MTTNCIQKPKESYMARIFTCGLVEWPGAVHIENRDFAPVIKAALEAPGFAEDAPEKRIMIGFARNAVLGAAEKVVELVKEGKIRHFFLIGGCDGAKSGRNYYTEFAEKHRRIPSSLRSHAASTASTSLNSRHRRHTPST